MQKLKSYRKNLVFPKDAPVLARICARLCNILVRLEYLFTVWIWDRNNNLRTQAELVIPKENSIIELVRQDEYLLGLYTRVIDRKGLDNELVHISDDCVCVRSLIIEQFLVEENQKYSGLTKVARKTVDLSRYVLLFVLVTPVFLFLIVCLGTLWCQEKVSITYDRLSRFLGQIRKSK